MIWLALALLILIWSSILWAYRREIVRCWQEPALKRPVLIIESDDWGPGPDSDAGALNCIAETLQEFQDTRGRHPVMTLGLILSVPDGSRIERSSFGEYSRVELDDGRTARVLESVFHGIHNGVFSAQLHGHEHFWPPSLMRASRDNAELRDWFCKNPFPRTEELPSHLQSRWVDAAALPSKGLDAKLIREALLLELECFERVLGMRPTVYVPPTFIWTDMVERTLTEYGVKALVTPGRRCLRHAASGEPVVGGTRYFNGQLLGSMAIIVRDIYFEPIRGHTTGRALAQILDRCRAGRPALLETHRANFIGMEEERGASLEELRRLLSSVMTYLPDIRFLSTEELASAYAQASGDLIKKVDFGGFRFCLSVWEKRSRMRKLAIASGLGILAWFFLIGVPRQGPTSAV